jgi:hypothetical protein
MTWKKFFTAVDNSGLPHNVVTVLAMLDLAWTLTVDGYQQYMRAHPTD